MEYLRAVSEKCPQTTGIPYPESFHVAIFCSCVNFPTVLPDDSWIDFYRGALEKGLLNESSDKEAIDLFLSLLSRTL